MNHVSTSNHALVLSPASRLSTWVVLSCLVAATPAPSRAQSPAPSRAQSYDELVAAAGAGRTAEVRRLLAAGVAPDPERNAKTALGAAAEGGHVEAGKLLLEAGASPDRNDGGVPPLHRAARRGDLAFAKLLLDGGAKIDIGSMSSGNALSAAAKAKQGAMVTLLLERGASVTGERGSDHYPLLVAAEQGDAGIVRQLLAAGMKPEKRCLNQAARLGHVEVVEAFLDAGVEVDRPGVNNRTPLMSAAFSGQVDVARLLVERGANPAAQDIEGKTAAILAAERGQHEVVEYLESVPAAAGATGASGQTARDVLYAREQEERRRQNPQPRRHPRSLHELAGFTYAKPEGFESYSAFSLTMESSVTLISPGPNDDGDYVTELVGDEIRIDYVLIEDPLSPGSFDQTLLAAPGAREVEVEWQGLRLRAVRSEIPREPDAVITYTVDVPLVPQPAHVVLQGPSTRLAEIEAAWSDTLASLDGDSNWPGHRRPSAGTAGGGESAGAAEPAGSETSSASPPAGGASFLAGNGKWLAVGVVVLFGLLVWFRRSR
jgi:ankyrin repeat protein